MDKSLKSVFHLCFICGLFSELVVGFPTFVGSVRFPFTRSKRILFAVSSITVRLAQLRGEIFFTARMPTLLRDVGMAPRNRLMQWQGKEETTSRLF